MYFKIEFIALAPEIFLITLIHCFIVYGVICATSSYLSYPIIINNLTWLGLQVLIITGFLVAFNPLVCVLCFNELLLIDEFGSFIKIVIIVSTIFTILIALKYNQLETINAFETIILILLAVFGILLLSSSFHFIAIYLAIEVNSFCLYIIASLNRNSEFSTEAGLKYFILGAFSSGLLLFGISLIYGFSGLLSFCDLHQFFCVGDHNTYFISSLNLASVFILVSLLFKLSAAPFHIWVPDIYEGSPTSVTTFFAVVPKIAILTLLTRFTFIGFYDFLLVWQELFVITAIFSIFVGTFGGLSQLKLKRLLAYSTISHVGYILIGFSVGSFEGIHASFIYILFYMVTVLISFITILGIYQQKKFGRLNYLKDLNALTNANPILSICFAVAFFSIAGIPPLGGFFSKMLLFVASIESDAYVLAIIGVITSVISCFYYIRIIKLLSFNTKYTWVSICRFGRECALILASLTILLIFLIVYPLPIIYGSQNILYFIVKNQISFLSI